VQERVNGRGFPATGGTGGEEHASAVFDPTLQAQQIPGRKSKVIDRALQLFGIQQADRQRLAAL
jgi:hypothetical protein